VTLYRVIAEQKITKKVIVVVNAKSEEEALQKVCNGEIVSAESTVDTKIDGYFPLDKAVQIDEDTT